MARADLLIRLAQSGMQGDKVTFRKVIESIIAEERVKHRKVLAERLEAILQGNASISGSRFNGSDSISDRRTGDFFQEIFPEVILSDLVLPDEVQNICSDLIQEYHRIDLLRSYDVEPRNRILLIGPP